MLLDCGFCRNALTDAASGPYKGDRLLEILGSGGGSFSVLSKLFLTRGPYKGDKLGVASLRMLVMESDCWTEVPGLLWREVLQ